MAVSPCSPPTPPQKPACPRLPSPTCPSGPRPTFPPWPGVPAHWRGVCLNQRRRHAQTHTHRKGRPAVTLPYVWEWHLDDTGSRIIRAYLSSLVLAPLQDGVGKIAFADTNISQRLAKIYSYVSEIAEILSMMISFKKKKKKYYDNRIIFCLLQFFRRQIGIYLTKKIFPSCVPHKYWNIK